MSTFRRLKLLFAGAFLAVVAGFVPNPLRAAQVRGRLLFSAQVPAVGIRIRLTNAHGVTPFFISGRDGRYYLNGIPAGAYTLEVWRNGVVVPSLSRNIDVREPALEAGDSTLP